jgi:hypothetical protein
MSYGLNRPERKVWAVELLFCALAMGVPACLGADLAPRNLALAALGARARSWEPGVTIVPGHEPARANDGTTHTYWAVRADDLPADLGIEWPQPQSISSLVIRYWDGRMVRGPAVARTQQWARLQYWRQGNWQDLDAQVFGQATSTVRYKFSPVTTTRIRLLFTEPPNPESLGHLPGRLGIYICEFEAYKDAPFQVVSSLGHPERIVDREGPNYNESAGDDDPYDLASPLVIEPQQTRIFTDTLTPTLIVSESRWAREPALADQTRQRLVRLRNGFLQLDISTASGIRETGLTNRVTRESAATNPSRAFLIRTSQGEMAPDDFKVVKVDTSASDRQVARLRVSLSSPKLELAVNYELRAQDHFYHKWLSLTNKTNSDLQVLDVVLSSLDLPRSLDLMAGTELTYPISRLKKGGFFSCLETVYWDHQGDTLTYYPGVTIPAGNTYETEKAVVGVYKNRGEDVAGWDRGVREWLVEYHAQISPVPEAWPDVYCEGWSAKIGVKEMLERPEWTERFMATAEKLGIRYMDAYEPTPQALAMPPAWLKHWVDLATAHQIGTGWWNDFGSDNDWGTGAPFKPYACKLSPEAETYFQRTTELVRTYKLRGLHWGDFFTVWPCDHSEHGHLPGKYSIYAQGQRMVRFAREMHESSPGLMLGADGGLNNPQYGRYADSRHHGGGVDGQPAAEPDIHLDRLYADMNIAYLYGLAHETFLRPWYRLLNCVNHFGQESHLHDRAGYRYGLLAALALAGEMTFSDVPDNIPESEIAFTERWEKWAITNKDYLKQTDRLFDRSHRFDDILEGDADSLAGFAHIRGDRGYVFLLNPGPVEQIAELALALDAAPSTRFVVDEVYPGGMTLQGPFEGEYSQGGQLRVTVPAKQVRILWIAPASASGQHHFQPEDARLAEARRDLGEWSVVRSSPASATLRAQFEFHAHARPYLSTSVRESKWSADPWAYDKAYLVFGLKNEKGAQDDHWVPDSLQMQAGAEPMAVQINGVTKTLHPFKTRRNQLEGLTRCYFVSLEGETMPGQPNEVLLTLPIRQGLAFSGAYLDLPDQMPLGETAGE